MRVEVVAVEKVLQYKSLITILKNLPSLGGFFIDMLLGGVHTIGENCSINGTK